MKTQIALIAITSSNWKSEKLKNKQTDWFKGKKCEDRMDLRVKGELPAGIGVHLG